MSVSRKQDIAQRFSRAAAGYADFASLQAAIADTLLARSEVAGVVLDGGCGRGRESAQLAARAVVEEVIALDMAPGMLAEIPGLAKIWPLLGDIEAIPLPDTCVDHVFSSFALQWCDSREQACRELFRVLRPGGTLLASVPGPASLQALKTGELLHINTFAGEQEWAVALMQAGFSACEFVRWDFAMHFATAHELLKALQGIGATTSDMPRESHLHGKQWLQQVCAALEAAREPQGLPLRYDVIFIQATREQES
jgi:malonyl-CoA O-methyltransferase